jgi:uncharacterized protein YndB with AHSA1/START domain
MNHYRKSLVLEAGPAIVYAALATPEGLRGWWSQDSDIATDVGGTSHLRFGRTYKDMRIDNLEPGREVRWTCTGAHIATGDLTRRDEWVGTQVVFRLLPDAQGHTLLEFEHVGLVPALECYDLCDDGWRYFLDSLRKLVESGRGTPYVPAAAIAA